MHPRWCSEMNDIDLGKAVDRYRAKFREAPPMTLAVHSDDYLALVAAMDQAIQRGRRMTQREVLAIGGMTAPRGYGVKPPGTWPPVL